MDELIINNLLVTAGSIIDKYSAIARETGRSFNIFEVARIEDKEVIVCRILAELLNPKGRHGQGGAYLELFLSECCDMGDALSDAEIENMQVAAERMTDKGRPVDLVIEGNGRCIPIEVKIYAADQSAQCYDYCMYARTKDSEARIIYLTLFGEEPSDDSRGKLSDDDIIFMSFDVHILRWLEKCLALPDTIRKTPLREILIQFISAIRNITNNLEDKPKMELIKLLSESPQHMRNAKVIADTLDECRFEIATKFFTAFHERFGSNFESEPLESDFVKWGNSINAEIRYMFEKDVVPGVSVIFILNMSNYDPLLAGFGMIREGESARLGDRNIVKKLRTHYGVEEKKSSAHCVVYEYISFEDDWINMTNFNGSYENYFKLFDPKTFEEILDSTVKQANAVLAKLK
ncbi:MAG: PD-(D/E)XK nuclease family protein [Oscillospiraceae bacterium]|nr:PD-(D/E)XK nuclease family protein [Oscillospiraceae bacterium]